MTVHVIRERWNDREALRLMNGAIEIVVLIGGGHLAEIRLAPGGDTGLNCLWTSPWPTADPDSQRAAQLVSCYGSDPAARFLASYTGHALCLDLFGPPSPNEAALGIALHGEAAVQTWSFRPTPDGCIGEVALAVAQLRVARSLSLASGSAVLFITERIENRGAQLRELQWVQHLTLGPPFLDASDSFLTASLDHGLTWPFGYEGCARLRDSAPFQWPYAPEVDGNIADLRVPFACAGTGFIAAARVSLDRDLAFIAALNIRIGVALVYCFRRRDFPWIAIWEENCARTTLPWNGTVRARGMEFGTTPLPVGRNASRVMGSLLDTPSTRNLASGQTLDARYLAAVVTVPAGWRSIADVQVERNALRLRGQQTGSSIEVHIHGLSEFFKGDNEV